MYDSLTFRSIAHNSVAIRFRVNPSINMLRTASRVIGVRRFSSATAAPSSGPPFKRYFLYTTAIMFGVPGVIGATFVYNLRSDDTFYSHFNTRYPELIAAINERFPLDPQSVVDFASRTDIGPITPPSELQDESECVACKRSHWIDTTRAHTCL